MPPQNTAKNIPPQDAAENISLSQNVTGNIFLSINFAGDASSSKKYKLSRDAKSKNKFKDSILPDFSQLLNLNQLAEENNPITKNENDKNNSTPTVSFVLIIDVIVDIIIDINTFIGPSCTYS